MKRALSLLLISLTGIAHAELNVPAYPTSMHRYSKNGVSPHCPSCRTAEADWVAKHRAHDK